jgi:hypothetical protein
MPSQLEALLQQARSGLANANSSLLDNRYPVYPGQTRPEMSAMTNRKRQIEDQYRLKRPSYTRAIQHNTHRNLGFKEGDTQGLLDRISAQQQNLGRFGVQRIKNTFGDTYSGNLEGKIGKDTLAKNAQSRVGFDNLANEARNIDTRDNNKTLQTLNALSLSKNANKEGVLGLLEQLGNQKHAYDQARFNADRAMFNRQANYPYSRIQGMGDAVSGALNVADAVRRDRLNAEQGGEANPLAPTQAEEGYAANRLRRGMSSLNTSYPVYPGKLVADLNPDMKLSYNLAERLEPNIQDNSYEERRRLRKGLTDGDITSQKALASLNDKASPLEQNLDKDAQRLIKQATAKINASRVMNGTFGSKSHQSELDAAIRDIVSGKYGSRANITTDTLNRSLTDLSRENDVNNERVRELDRTGSREISDAFNQIRSINQRGVTDWGNEQNRLNQAFQQFADESDWENNNNRGISNPQNRGLAIAGGIERAGSQSPLVLPQALQFNNLQANIPFEETKVAAPTTDPRIQRTSQLFNDEEEMRRIADAARERQNREELANREAELVRQRAAEEEARRQQELARQQEANRIRAQQEEARRRAQAEYQIQAQIREQRSNDIYKKLWLSYLDKEGRGGEAFVDGARYHISRITRPLGLGGSEVNFINSQLFRDNPGIHFGNIEKMLLDRNRNIRQAYQNRRPQEEIFRKPLEDYTPDLAKNMSIRILDKIPLSQLVDIIPEIEQRGAEYPVEIMRDALRGKKYKEDTRRRDYWARVGHYPGSNPSDSELKNNVNLAINNLTDQQVKEQFNPLINERGGAYEADKLHLPIGGLYYHNQFGPIKITPTGNVEQSFLPDDLKYVIKYNKNFSKSQKTLEQLMSGTEARKTAAKNQLRDILSAVGLNFNYN